MADAVYGAGVYGTDVYYAEALPVIRGGRPPDWLAVEVVHPDGSSSRWSPHEPGAEDVYSDLSFSTSIPGGDKSLTCTLKRRIDRDYPDLGLVDRIRVYGPGGQTVFSGEQAEFPRQHDTDFSISVGAVGRSAALKRFRNFTAVYIDRDPGSWHEAPLWRRAELAAASWALGKIQASSGSGGLVWDLPNEALPNNTAAELWYEAPAGVNVAEFGYRGSQSGTFTSIEAATLYPTDSSAATSSFDSAGLTLDNTFRQVALATARRRLMLWARTTGAVTPPVGTQRRFDRLAVFGDHGLTTRDVSGDMDGLYLSDIKEHIVAQCLPGIETDIEPDSTVIAHLVCEGMTGEEAYLQANKFGFHEWGMYGDTFFDRVPDPDRLCWQARLSDGIGLSLEGPQSEDVYNGAVVSFQDFDGETRTIGPIGFGCDYESDNLRDWQAQNPYNLWGEINFGKLDISQPTNSTNAEVIGIAWLNEASAPKRRGSVVLHGTVRHPTMGDRPVWEVRAGDWIQITDASNDVPRRILETSYVDDSRTLTASIDNTASTTEALMELMGINLVGVF